MVPVFFGDATCEQFLFYIIKSKIAAQTHWRLWPSMTFCGLVRLWKDLVCLQWNEAVTAHAVLH